MSGPQGRKWVARAVARTLATLLLLVALTPILATSSARAATAEPVPASMAALGDSITRGFNTCGWFFDCTSRSWSTGAQDEVYSHFERFRVYDSRRMKKAHNLARTGAKMDELATQAQNAVANGVGYVTILLGANDACTDTESQMTPVADFRAQFTSGIDVLAAGLPETKVFVASIPDIRRLWEVGKDSLSARNAWNTYDICQSMLANPTSTAQEDIDRRQRVWQRVVDYNTALAEVCAAYANCRFDGNAIFSYPFELGHLSTWDYFHPNTSGQNVLADVTWAAGFTWQQNGPLRIDPLKPSFRRAEQANPDATTAAGSPRD